jgi:hypothetical protein
MCVCVLFDQYYAMISDVITAFFMCFHFFYHYIFIEYFSQYLISTVRVTFRVVSTVLALVDNNGSQSTFYAKTIGDV